MLALELVRHLLVVLLRKERKLLPEEEEALEFAIAHAAKEKAINASDVRRVFCAIGCLRESQPYAKGTAGGIVSLLNRMDRARP